MSKNKSRPPDNITPLSLFDAHVMSDALSQSVQTNPQPLRLPSQDLMRVDPLDLSFPLLPAHVEMDTPSPEILSTLNEAQRSAVMATEGPVLILAGPGSGKTRVITHRIAYLVREKRVHPKKILAVTFTNKAAREMRDRLETLLPTAAPNILTTTFHSLCAKILRRPESEPFLVTLGLTSSFLIADENDSIKLIREAIKSIDLQGLQENEKTPEALYDTISRMKNEMISANDLEEQAYREGKYGLLIFSQVYREMDRLARKYKFIDFDDLLLISVSFLHNDIQARTYFQQRWSHICVDEWQDSNKPQYMLIRLLGRGTDDQLTGHRNVLVVGDDDQMIFGWRGAKSENIDKFDQDFPDRKIFYLEQNYRSTNTIVQASQSVVRENIHRREKNLWTELENGPPIVIAVTKTEDDEAEYVVKTIRELLKTGYLTKWRDCAVLYRTNGQSRAIEEACLHASVPYRIIGSTTFYQRWEIKNLLAYLRLLIHPVDDISLLRIINVPTRKIGSKTVQGLQEWAVQRDLSLWEALTRIHECTLLDRGAKRALTQFVQLISSLRQLIDELPFLDLLDQVTQKSGIEASFKNGGEEQQERWANIQEIRRVATAFVGMQTRQALDLFLEHVTLMSGADTVVRGEVIETDENVPKEQEWDAITLITLHMVKGMEFPVVFIVGFEENLLPHSRTLLEGDPGGIEEERRLAYVGFTRAMQRLYLLRASKRVVFGKLQRSGPSRFLNAIPRHLLVEQISV